nr:uncharacterized protein LOC113722556 [Coffea arabica]
MGKFIDTFFYVIKYKTGKTNVVADALSRRHSLLVVLDAKLLGFEMLKDIYAHDTDFSDIYASCMKSPHGKLHEAIRANIERHTQQYIQQANKHRCKMVFEPGDWVWLHLRKESSPSSVKASYPQEVMNPFECSNESMTMLRNWSYLENTMLVRLSMSRI